MTITESRLSFSFPKEMKDKLVILSKEDNRTLSSYIRNVLQANITENAEIINELVTSRTKKRTRREISK